MYNFPLALKHLFPTIKQKPLRTVLCFLCNTHIPIQLFVPNAPQKAYKIIDMAKEKMSSILFTLLHFKKIKVA